MGYALILAVYDFTPIHSRLWQSVAMAVGYPACGTANPSLFKSPLKIYVGDATNLITTKIKSEGHFN